MKIPIKNKDLYTAQPSSWAAPSLKEQEIIFSQSKKAKKHEPETGAVKLLQRDNY